MAKAYKITSDPFYVNGSITESAANTYTQEQISLPLDSLNREGVLVHAVYFTSDEPEQVPNVRTTVTLQVSSTSKTGLIGANDANLVARRQIFVSGGAAEFSGPHIVDLIGAETPYTTDMNLAIIATDDVFFAIKGLNNTGALNGQFRMVCSRIQLEASAYAALVTNELSS